MFKGISILGFLDNIGLNKFREISLQPKVGVNRDNNPEQQNNQSNIFSTPQKDTFEPSFRRLNDLDTEIINKNLFKFLPTDSLRIELQLEVFEKRLKDVETNMNVLAFLGYEREHEKFVALEQKKQHISREILQYRQEYRDLGITYKIADTFLDLFQRTKNTVFNTKTAFMGSSLVTGVKGFFPGLKKGEEIKQTLNRSIMFGNSISNLLSPTVMPFGENEQRLFELSQMMAKANGLDSKISKLLNTAASSGSKIGNGFKELNDKAILSFNNFVDKIKLVLPKKSGQENFFELLGSKTDPP